MKKTTVAILFGGYSTEYEVSLKSAYSVIKNLSPERYDVIMLGITRQGEWRRFDGEIECIRDDTWQIQESCVPAVISPDRNIRGIVVLKDGKWTTIPIDVAFPVLHGTNGEDGTVQGLLKMAGIPFVGCGTLSSALCMDKDIAHRLVKAAGIRTPNAVTLHETASQEEQFEQTAHLRCPLFIKPANAGSSIGLSRIFDRADLIEAVSRAFQYDHKVIVEEAVEGFEVGCALIGNATPIIGAVDEIELSGCLFDYTEKYTQETARLHMPARISKDVAQRIKETALKIYHVLECSGLARVDLFLTPENEIVFNEVNTLPGLTTHSRYPGMLKGIGMTFEQIVDELIRLATCDG